MTDVEPAVASLTVELHDGLAALDTSPPAQRVAALLLAALQPRMGFTSGAVYLIMGAQTARAAAFPEDQGLEGAQGVTFLDQAPALQAFRRDPTYYRAAATRAAEDWAEHPLLPGAGSFLAVPAGDVASWGAVLVLGWPGQTDAATADVAPALEGATWLGNWLATMAGSTRRQARTVMQSPVHALPGDGVQTAWSLQREASGILHRAMRATGRSRGILLGLDGGEPTLLANSRLDWSRIRRSTPLALALQQTANSTEAREPVYLTPDDHTGESLLLIPLAHAGQPAHGLILLSGERRRGYTLQDFLSSEEVSQAAAYHVKALQQAWYSNGERVTHQHLEALIEELGHKLSFEEMFQVVARWVPRLVPASWVGVSRIPSTGAGGPAEGQRISDEVWISRTGGVQPPLIPSLAPLLNQIDPALPLTCLTPEQLNGVTPHPLVVIPVHLGGQTIAALAVASATSAGFNDRHLATLRELSTSVALAFRYVQLFEMVEQAKRDWEHSFDAITDTLAVISPQRQVRRVNRGFLQERGLRIGQAINEPCHLALYGHTEPCAGCPLDKALALRTTTEVEVRSAANNSLYLASLFPVQNDEGEVIDFVEFAKDVTLSRDLQDKLLQTERLRALGEMASGTAHDFNNTLAGVLGQVELLLASKPEPDMERGLRIIAQAASDGAATVRRIQNFSKTSRGEDVVPSDLNQIVLDAVDVCAPRWKDQSERDGVSLQLRQDLRANSLVAGVPSELREVLVNVLLNAIEAMPGGGTIALRTGENSRWVWVAVTDQGVGMTDEVRRHIFDPFYTTKGMANSGLGMSVVYGIIKLHRGDISVASEEGKGTTVTIRLPKAQRAEPKAAPAVEPPPAQALRILVADDDQRLADMLRQMLALDGHQVTLCHGGAEALEQLAVNTFDVVLTDLGMPDVSGWDVIAAVRQQLPHAGTGLVTGWGVQLEEVEVSSKGVDVVIPKPYTLAALRAAIGRLTELRTARTAATTA